MELEPIICKNCGSVDDYTVRISGNQCPAYCNSCGKWIKNIPYDVPRMYVGKYKGTPIHEITDLSYLEWAVENMTALKNQDKKNIRFRILELKNPAPNNERFMDKAK